MRTPHHHCCYCGRTVTRQELFIRHLNTCSNVVTLGIPLFRYFLYFNIHAPSFLTDFSLNMLALSLCPPSILQPPPVCHSLNTFYMINIQKMKLSSKMATLSWQGRISRLWGFERTWIPRYPGSSFQNSSWMIRKKFKKFCGHFNVPTLKWKAKLFRGCMWLFLEL